MFKDFKLWYYKHWGKRIYGYSESFKKDGYFFRDKKNNSWWFVPSDHSFTYGFPAMGIEPALKKGTDKNETH